MLRNDVAKAGDKPEVTVTHTDTGNDPLLPFVPPRGEEEAPQLKERAFNRYEVVAEHGRGGLGKVMRARDKDLGRDVAIKEMLSPGGMAEARFVREAMITARLEHPGIVPVHDAGRWPDGTPFYSMKLVSGRPLKELIHSAKTLEERLALLPHVIAVADAIAYAHDRGIIHRDLKPSNIIVGQFGETVVIDWGIAKDLKDAARLPEIDGPYRVADNHGLTMAGAVLGTPAYMAPEQASGHDADERADVYALGAILYHVLVGEQPYGAVASHEVIARIAAGPPPLLASRAPAVPRDLSAIVDKAMRRDPFSRYPDARAIADDLKRFQAGQFVSAHHYSPLSIIMRWLVKYRAAAGVAVVLLLILALTSLLSIRRILHERSLATQAQGFAETHANELLLVQAQSQLSQDPTAALEWVSKYAEKNKDMGRARDIAADAASRGVARYVLHAKTGAVEAMTFGVSGRLFSTDSGSRLASWDMVDGSKEVTRQIFDNSKLVSARNAALLAFEDGNGNVIVSNVDGRVAARLPGHQGAILMMEFSPDGKWITTADWGAVTRLWNVADGGSLVWERKDLLTTAFYDDDRLLVARSGKSASVSVVTLEELSTGTARVSLEVSGYIAELAAAPMARKAAYSTADGRIGWLDMASSVSRELGQVDGVAHVAMSNDGGFVAGGSRKGGVKLWGIAVDAVVADYHHASPVISLAFSKGLLISAGEEGVIVAVDSDGGATSRFNTGGPIIVPAAISNDGDWLAASSANNIRIWDLSRPRAKLAVLHRIGTFNSAFVGDHVVVSDGTDGRVVAWDIIANTKVTLAQHADLVFGLSVSNDRTTVGWASHDGTAGIWSSRSNQQHILRGHSGSVMGIAVAPAGNIIATAGADRTVRLWDAHGALFQTFDGFADLVYRVSFSSDGRLLAAISRDGVVRVLDVTTMATVNESAHAGLPFWIPGTHKLILASPGGLVQIWSPESGDTLRISKHEGPVTSVSASPDGRLIVSSGADGVVDALDLVTGKHQIFHAIDGWPLHVLATSNDVIVATCKDGTVRLWRFGDGSASVLRSGSDSASASALSESGDALSTTVGSGAVAIWDLVHIDYVPSSAISFTRWMHKQSTNLE